jgi:hypothetical protein
MQGRGAATRGGGPAGSIRSGSGSLSSVARVGWHSLPVRQFAYPFRAIYGGYGNASALGFGGDPAIAAGPADSAGLGKDAERVGHDLVADAELLAKGGGGERLGGADDEG